MEEKPKLPKLPLNQALERLLEIFRIEEDGGNTDEAIELALITAHGQLADSVDRRIAFVNTLTGGDSFRPKEMGGLIGQAKTKVKQWQERAKMLQKILDRIERTTQEVVEQSPVTLFGSEHRLELQNGPPALRTMFARDQRSLSNIISREMVDYHGIPAKYLVETHLTQLVTDELSRDLKAGTSYPWASLETSKFLRIRLK